MFKNKIVNMHLKCNESTFSNYPDLISKDGHKYLEKQGFRHYIICAIPRINFTSYDPVREEVHVNIQKDANNFIAKIIKIKAGAIALNEKTGEKFATKIREIEQTTYPEIKVILDNGYCQLFANTYEFLCHVLEVGNDILFHKIIYIGQTKVTGKYLRLEKHEKVGKIAENYLSSKPDVLLAIKLLKFEKPEIMVSKDEEINGEAEKMIGKMTPNQITNLIEAALINAYKPTFNTHFKNNFPSAKHRHYNFIYKKIVDTISLEVNENLRSYSLNLSGYVSNQQLFCWSLIGNPRADFKDIFITNK
ncbi:hypothetical protein LQK91_21265 [Pantoea sp. MHSD4]|uniref:hypothetical protein n=1 Tax=Pantoea sp. MHSD4 TaxID=2898077 RepID=UPI000CF36669|nr:hypothetical protein [Pantoea sp. MHSD4]MCD2358935.1 hypothetical protein [Pantoea sp. MHSD4]PQL26235.1 hypothetical protein C5L22_21465 [Pantoea ananatis]